MSTLPFVLVLISAVTHGLWNFLAKHAHDKDLFIGISKMAEIFIFLVPFAIGGGNVCPLLKLVGVRMLLLVSALIAWAK